MAAIIQNPSSHLLTATMASPKHNTTIAVPLHTTSSKSRHHITTNSPHSPTKQQSCSHLLQTHNHSSYHHKTIHGLTSQKPNPPQTQAVLVPSHHQGSAVAAAQSTTVAAAVHRQTTSIDPTQSQRCYKKRRDAQERTNQRKAAG
jgi:hypothetical protein